VVNCPFSAAFIFSSFVVWAISIIFDERVADAFVKEFSSVLWAIWTLCLWNYVREAKIREK